MAADACHVIYEIRITRQYFKWNPEPGQTKHIVEGIFFITAACLHVVSFHTHAVVPDHVLFCISRKCTESFFLIFRLCLLELIFFHCSIVFYYIPWEISTIFSIFYKVWHHLSDDECIFITICLYYFLLSSSLSLWGHNRARRQVFLT